MEHLNNEEQKETIYFLEWLSQESGFTENQILENMKPSNQKWANIEPYDSIENYIFENIEFDYCTQLFSWKNSFLKPDHNFWENINFKWETIIDSKNYHIEFSRYPIKNWKLKIPFEKIKVKSKKLKI